MLSELVISLSNQAKPFENLTRLAQYFYGFPALAVWLVLFLSCFFTPIAGFKTSHLFLLSRLCQGKHLSFLSKTIHSNPWHFWMMLHILHMPYSQFTLSPYQFSSNIIFHLITIEANAGQNLSPVATLIWRDHPHQVTKSEWENPDIKSGSSRIRPEGEGIW